MAKFVINLKDVMDVSTRNYISNNVEMFKSTTPGPKGDDGLRGPQGVGVHHMKGTSTTDHEGDFSTAGEYDTYTFYADANEEFPLAWFTVKNGEDPWRRAVDRGYRGTEEEFYTVLGMVEEYAMASLEAMEVTTENREQVALDAAQVAEDRIAVEEAKDLAIEKADVHIARVDNPHGVTKAQVGLSDVDNTSDVDKPISTATANALALKTDTATLESLNAFRADKVLASKDVANLIYSDGNLVKIRYTIDDDVDYEVLTYSGEDLTNVAHYLGGVLQGNTVLTYASDELVSSIFVGV